jgi:hypothetical protein
MTAEQFTYWLQGFIETADPKFIDERQTQIIKEHLKLVFNKVTPSVTIQPSNVFNPYESNPQPKGIFDYFPPVTIC